MDLSIIIINYNTFDLTCQCIQSIIKETTNIGYEIIVVDNASTEKNSEELKTIFPSIRLIKNATNVGFGIANNIGMQAAKGNYLLLLNSDTIVLNQAIEQSLNTIKNNPQIGALTCSQINENGKPIMPASFYFKKFSLLSYLLSNPLFEIIRQKTTKNTNVFLTKNTMVNNLSGAYLMLKKEVFEKTKGFDPDFFIYYEETEWCNRLKNNYQLYYLHDATIIHLHGKSSPRPIMFKQMHLSGGLFWYKKGITTYVLYLLITYLIYFPAWLALYVFAFKQQTKTHFKKYVTTYWALVGYFFIEIPNYPNHYGGRTKMLKLKELK